MLDPCVPPYEVEADEPDTILLDEAIELENEVFSIARDLSICEESWRASDGGGI